MVDGEVRCESEADRLVAVDVRRCLRGVYRLDTRLGCALLHVRGVGVVGTVLWKGWA